MSDKKDIDKVLNFDAFYEAEKVTGKSYKEDKLTEKMGFMFHIMKTQEANKLLKENDDTTYNSAIEYYLKVVKDLGFEEVSKEDFYSKSSRKQESFYIFWHPKGILLHFDTYNGNINGGDFHYNWKPHSWKDEYHQYLSSHDAISDRKDPDDKDRWVVSGNHDCREALRHKINGLMENGEFINPWMREKTWIRLSHHGDKKESLKYDSEHINKMIEKRLEVLPENIKKCIRKNK